VFRKNNAHRHLPWPPLERFQPSEPVEITITTTATPSPWTPAPARAAFDGSCHYTAPGAQVGEQRRMEGDYSCSSGRKGRFKMRTSS
jgi:hypothetical protein